MLTPFSTGWDQFIVIGSNRNIAQLVQHVTKSFEGGSVWGSHPGKTHCSTHKTLKVETWKYKVWDGRGLYAILTWGILEPHLPEYMNTHTDLKIDQCELFSRTIQPWRGCSSHPKVHEFLTKPRLLTEVKELTYFRKWYFVHACGKNHLL